MPFTAIRMDLEIIMLSEVRERQIVYYFYVDSKKKKKKEYKWTYLQSRNRVPEVENKLIVSRI